VPPKQEVPSPMLSLSVDEPNLGTAYTLIPPPPVQDADGNIFRQYYLSSSFESTLPLLNTKLKLTSARAVHPDLKSKATQQDYIGIVRSHDFTPNSMIYGVNNRKAYLTCDPRKADKPVTKNSLEKNRCNTDSIPVQFRKLKSYRGKQRMKRFDYSAYNKTPFVGLENNTLYSYTNVMIQVLYSYDVFREEAFQSQQSIKQQLSQNTLMCELGFLFHMISSITRSNTKSS
jgi:hypothetical protein